MATSHSPSSSSPDPTHPTFQPPVSKHPSRRLPPPCWSDDETVALITVYREKWYSLRRGNLRAPDWQDVADGVAARCPMSVPPKTSIQCRHKMEKLRKRYRSEIQRIGNNNNNNNRKGYGGSSSWVHFKLMDFMELGVSRSDPDQDLNNNNNNNNNNRNNNNNNNSSSNNINQYDDVADENENENEDDLMLYQPKLVKQVSQVTNRWYPGSGMGMGASGVRIKIPNFSRSFDDLPPTMNRGNGVKRKEDVMGEMVEAITKLGERFVKMERMKMDMARELESMRMKAEMKQTEMILETHQKLWDSFSESVLGRKKKGKGKRVPEQEG